MGQCESFPHKDLEHRIDRSGFYVTSGRSEKLVRDHEQSPKLGGHFDPASFASKPHSSGQVLYEERVDLGTVNRFGNVVSRFSIRPTSKAQPIYACS